MAEKLPQSLAEYDLRGRFYQQHVVGYAGEGEDVDCTYSLNVLAKNSGYIDKVDGLVDDALPKLKKLTDDSGYGPLDAALKHDGELTYEDAYTAITFVNVGLNRAIRRRIEELTGRNYTDGRERETHSMQSSALLTSLSMREVYRGLSADEIAGTVAGAVELDTVVRTSGSANRMFGFGGMGGDLGYRDTHDRQSKLFSLSTLGALALASEGPVHKHHSYPNTSKVAGQNAIESFGARSDFHSPEVFDRVLAESGLVMSSCHNTRTLHTLSHVLRGETINHVIGPLAFTTDSSTQIDALIGVNEKVHPATMVRAMSILKQQGVQNYGNSVVFCGTDQLIIDKRLLDEDAYYRTRGLKEAMRIDEVAPPPYGTVAAFAVCGEYRGTYALYPEDFYDKKVVTRIHQEDLLIPNETEAILAANLASLRGQDETKARYLAMTVGLGIFINRYAELADTFDDESGRVNATYLRAATQEAYERIMSGAAHDTLESYIESTRQYAGDSGLERL